MHRLDDIQRTLGELKGISSITFELVKGNTYRIQRIETRAANIETRVKHLEKEPASPSSTPATSWHQVILAIAILIGTVMNIAPKELASVALRAFGK